MTPLSAIACAQCAWVLDEVEHLSLEGDAFCCLGCVEGGPCICIATDDGTLQLRAGPFASQTELMRFAARLEQAPGVVHVDMTRANLGDARFRVATDSFDTLARAVQADPDHLVNIEAARNVIFAVLAPRDAVHEQPGETLLPGRTRFRVFRPNDPQPPTLDRSPSVINRPSSRRRVNLPAARPTFEEPANETVATYAPPVVSYEEPAFAPYVETPAGCFEVREVTVVASPFDSFVELNTFVATVRALPGVEETRVRRFYGGALTLAVDYGDATPLVDRLRAERGERWRVSCGGGDRIEILRAQIAPTAVG